MARKNRKGRGGHKFVMLPHYLLDSPAYLDLSPNARALYTQLARRYNGSNNGSIGLGAREAGRVCKISKDSAARAFDDLIEHGFIAVAQDASFDQKRLSREWLLTDFHDDRNGQGARKDFMRWGKEEQNIVAPEGRIVSPQGLCGKSSTKKPGHSLTTGTVDPKPTVSQSRLRDTYTSGHRQSVDDDMAAPAVSPDLSEARRRERQHTTSDDAPAPPLAVRHDGPLQVADMLPDFLRHRPDTPSIPEQGSAATGADLSAGERTFLSWLVGYGEDVTHRKAQQNLSGRMTGTEIGRVADTLARLGLISITPLSIGKRTSLTYAIRDPVLARSALVDPEQTELEKWIEGVSP